MIPHSKPCFREDQIEVVADALRRGELSRGNGVADLELVLSGMFDGAHAVVVSSGTAALYLALAALDVYSDDAVVIPSYTCNSLYSAVGHVGADALCCDTCRDAVVPGDSEIKEVARASIKAVIIPHMFGYLADIDAVRKMGYPVIEDCAQAIGGVFQDGSSAGSKGDISVFSYYATKLVPAGEGGACVTNNRKLADTIRRLRNCDESAPDIRAFNFKMSDALSYAAIQQLKDIRRIVAERNRLADEYDRTFGARSYRRISCRPQNVCFRYLISLRETAWEKKGIDAFLEKAEREAGIQCRRPVWKPLHRSVGGNCPNSDILHETLVSVPLYPGLSEDDVSRICCDLSGLIEE